MIRLFKNGIVYYQNKLQTIDFIIDHEGRLVIQDDFSAFTIDEVINCQGLTVIPGIIDPHVHLREPGFEYKETIMTGTAAAARGGVTTVFSMPNLKPAPDNVHNIQIQKDIIKKDSCIHVYPIGAITVGQKAHTGIVDFDALSKETKLFSDDGVGVQEESTMREAMREVKKHHGYIIAHCEDESELLPKGCIHAGKKAEEYGLVGINSASEYKQVIRDIQLVEETGCDYHICHISTKESVQALREGKDKNLPVSGEVTVHHLLLCEDDIKENHGRYKMNPPLRTKEDREALLQGVLDGTIEMIATDQAPHSEAEKNTTFDKASMGTVSIECSFALVYTYLVKPGIITLEKAIELMSTNAARRFKIKGGELIHGEKPDIAIFNLNVDEIVDPSEFVSKGKYTPFENMKVNARCEMTIVEGNIVYRRDVE